MTLLALKCLGLAWVFVILAFVAWIGWQVLLSALAEHRGRRSRRGRQDVAATREAYARWSRTGTR